MSSLASGALLALVKCDNYSRATRSSVEVWILVHKNYRTDDPPNRVSLCLWGGDSWSLHTLALRLPNVPMILSRSAGACGLSDTTILLLEFHAVEIKSPVFLYQASWAIARSKDLSKVMPSYRRQTTVLYCPQCKPQPCSVRHPAAWVHQFMTLIQNRRCHVRHTPGTGS